MALYGAQDYWADQSNAQLISHGRKSRYEEIIEKINNPKINLAST